MPTLNPDKLTQPVSRKVTATAGVAGVVAAALADVAASYHLDQYLRGGVLPLVIFLLTGLISGVVGYFVRHGWLSQGELDNAVSDYVDYAAAEEQAAGPPPPAAPAAPGTVGDATHLNGPDLTPADATEDSGADDPAPHLVDARDPG